MSRQMAIACVVLLVASAALAQGVQLPQARPRTPETLRVLNQRLPEVELVEQPFEQVMEWLAQLTKLNIVVRWQTLEDAGVERDTPVSIKVRNLRLSQVLWLIMNEVGGSELKLAYRASGTLLILSTEEDLSKEMVTKVYDVSDLLIRIPQASRQAAFDVTQGLGGEGGGGGGGGGMFRQGQDQSQWGNEPSQGGMDGQPSVELERLIELIQNTVEPDSWRINGGEGTIFPFQRLLVVRNTILVHQRLGGPISEDELVGD